MSEHELDHVAGPGRAGTDDERSDGPDERPSDGSAVEPTVVEVPTGAGTASLTLPPDADADEVAALVAAVTSRLTEDAPAEDADDEEPKPWRLAARLGVRRRVELPRVCRRGGEWSAAARRP